MKLVLFYVTNLAVPSFVNRCEKDELLCLGILCVEGKGKDDAMASRSSTKEG
jgi:hypothetical protein